jgi:hypothetical protein
LTRRARLTGAPDRSPQLGQLPWPVAPVAGCLRRCSWRPVPAPARTWRRRPNSQHPFCSCFAFPHNMYLMTFWLLKFLLHPLSFCGSRPPLLPAPPDHQQSNPGISFNVKHSQPSRSRGFGGVAVWLEGIEATRPQLAALLAPVPNGSPSNCVSDVVHTSGHSGSIVIVVAHWWEERADMKEGQCRIQVKAGAGCAGCI